MKAVIFDMYETLITHYKCPLYFSEEMSGDAGIAVDKFLPLWRSTEHDRWTGKLSFEDTIKMIMEKNNCFSKEKLDLISRKRTATKEEGFRNLHSEIIPMMEGLKEKGIKIGLISNCFSEEAKVIRKSILFPYFDFACLSYEQGLEKPDPKIYDVCTLNLGVKSEECIYVGDGGCMELETALSLGMKPLQAVWYFQDGLVYQSKRNPNFVQVEKPLDILNIVDKNQ